MPDLERAEGERPLKATPVLSADSTWPVAGCKAWVAELTVRAQ